MTQSISVNLSQLEAQKIKYFSVNSTGGTNENNDGATGDDAIAIGKNAGAAGNNATAIGLGASAAQRNNVAIGTSAIANGGTNDFGSTAIGFEATATGDGATALGSETKATGEGATAVGDDAEALASNSTALGDGSGVDATSIAGVAIGAEANVIGSSTGVAIGTFSETTADRGVALGFNSKANVEGGATGFAPTTASTADAAAITATNSTNLGAVSVGTGQAGGNRQIVNVAAGTTDSDAVNVAQLKSVANIANKGFNISAEGGTADNVQLGETVDFTNDDNNLVVTNTDNTINYDLADDISVNQVTIGDDTNETILTSTADGLDVGGDKITNIGAGAINAGSTDAVNGSQLFDTAESVANNLGGNSVVNPDGTVSAPSYELDDGSNTGTNTTVNNVGDALDNLDGRTSSNTTEINKGFNISAEGGTADNVKLGETVDFTNDDNNLVVTNTDNTINYDLADDISVNQVTIGDDT
ncbi:MAG: hypothetical protein ACTIJW_00770, partial [Psychrobacter sp.]